MWSLKSLGRTQSGDGFHQSSFSPWDLSDYVGVLGPRGLKTRSRRRGRLHRSRRSRSVASSGSRGRAQHLSEGQHGGADVSTPVLPRCGSQVLVTRTHGWRSETGLAANDATIYIDRCEVAMEDSGLQASRKAILVLLFVPLSFTATRRPRISQTRLASVSSGVSVGEWAARPTRAKSGWSSGTSTWHSGISRRNRA